MKCAVCHTQMEGKTGVIDLRVKGQLFLVENVTYEECPSCGERTLSPTVSQLLFEKIKSHDYSERTISVPVVDGALEQTRSLDG